MILVRSKIYFDSSWPSRMADKWRIRTVWETEDSKKAMEFFNTLVMYGYKTALIPCTKDPMCSRKVHESIVIRDGHFMIKDLWDVTVFASVDHE